LQRPAGLIGVYLQRQVFKSCPGNDSFVYPGGRPVASLFPGTPCLNEPLQIK